MTEFELITKYQKEGCILSRNKVVENNLGIVYAIVNTHNVTYDVREELVQEGMIGLIKSLDGFDVEKGFALTTYASFVIQQHIRTFLMKRIGVLSFVYKRDCFIKIYGNIHLLTEYTVQAIEDFAKLIKVKSKDVVEYLAYRQDATSDITLTNISGNSNPADIYQNEQEQSDLDHKILATLTVEEIKAIKLKYYNDVSFQEISKILNIPRTTVQNMTYRAINKLKKALA